MSITNNEVKFLVSLDIDKDKSKKRIDTFLSKEMKDKKLTFGVNVGASNKNIKTFLDKHKNKNINLSFDVAVGQSKANIQTFLNNQKQAKKSLIFYVNEQATQTTVKSALKKIQVQPLQISFGVNYQQSKANINEFIETVKVNQKPIELILEKKASVENINKSLEKIIFAKAKVKLELAKGAFNHIKDTVETKELQGLKTVMELDVEKTKLRISEQINKMSLPKFKIDVVANVTPVVSSETVQATVKEAPSHVKEIPSPPTDFNETIGALKELRSILVDINTKVTDLKKNTSEDTSLGKQVSDYSSKAIEFGQTISSIAEASDAASNSTSKFSKGANMLSTALGAVGVVGSIAGAAIQFVTARYEEAQKAKEELIAKNEQEIKSYAENEKSIDSLLVKYDNLSQESRNLNSVGKELDSNKYKELLDTQNELGKLMPDLVQGEDEYGNKVLVSTTQAKTKIEILQQELEIQKKLNAEKAKEEQEKADDTARDTIKDAKKDKENGLEHAYNLVYQMELVSNRYSELKGKLTEGIEINGDAWYSTKSVNSIDDVALAIDRVNEALSKKEELNLTDGAIRDLERTQAGLETIHLELLQAQNDIMSGLNVLKVGYKQDIEEIIKVSGDFSNEGQQMFEDVAKSVVNLANSEEQLDSFNDAVTKALGKKNANIENEFDNLAQAITDMKNSGVTDAKELESKFGDSMRGIRDSILKALVDSGIKEGSKTYKDFEKILNDSINTNLEYQKSINEIMVTQGKSKEEAIEWYDTHSEGKEAIEDANKTIKEYAESIRSYSTLGEQMLGVTDKLISETDDLVGVHSYLASVTDKTTDETNMLEEAMKKLKALYPHLIKNGELRIENVKAENEMNKILAKSAENMADERYNAEEEATYYSAIGTKARIDNLKLELEAILAVSKATFDKYEEIQAKYEKFGAYSETNKNGITESEQRYLMSASQSRGNYVGYGEYADKLKKLDEYTNDLNSSINKLSSSNDNLAKETDKSSKSTSKNAKETSELEKISNKYTLTLDKINTAMKEVESRKKKYPTYSKQYRQALADEIKLIQQQIDLQTQKANDLSGVQGTSSGSIYSTLGSVQPKGWSGKVTSNFGTRADNHKGIDIDGAIGDLLQSNVSGKVVAKGKDNVSGNYVYVMDSNGLKHFYAHLDSIAVAIGDVVDVGTKLGTIGNTGSTSKGKGGDGSHLHYGIKQGNTWIDPSSYAQSARSGVQTYSSTKVSGNSTQATVWNFFKSKGLSDVAVSAIMGNMQQESSFNSSEVNKTTGASGLAQWTDGRKANLQSYAKSKGTNWTDVQTQLEFMWQELNGAEKKSLAVLQKQGLSVADMTKQFENAFERSGNSAMAKRQGYANNIYNTYAGSGATAGGGPGNDDYARVQSERQNALQSAIDLKDKKQEYEFEIIKSQLAEYKRNRDIEDLGIAKQAELQKNMLEYNKEYENSVNKQYTAEQRKLKSYQQEYAYIQKIYDAGGWTIAQQDELIDRRYELQQQMLESQNQIKAYYNEIISGKLAGYDYKNDKFAKTLEWEEVKIQALDKTSERYRKTLEIMGNTRQGQIKTAKEELDYINKMLSKGNLTIEMYEELTQRADELKKGLVELNDALHQVNYEMVQAVAIGADLKIDDIDFEIAYNDSLMGLYESDSGDYKAGLEFKLDKLKEKYNLIEQKGLDIQKAMKGKDLGVKELQDLEEQLEDNVLAFMEVKNAIQDTEDAIKEFTKTIDEKIEEKRKNFAEEMIKALKDAINEAKDIQLKAIDKLIDAEQERHEKVMKQYDDELKAFTKIIDAKRREISDADRDRTYGNKLDELTTQKQELQNKLNLLSNVNTYEGIKEKEELKKQITEIEKQIEEEKYQYEKELREQQLDDILEEKTENIEELKDKEDEYSKEVLKNLNRQKEYWEKYYTDLLNDEKEFNRLKKLMMEGHYEEITAEYNKYINMLKASLPDLEDTFDGTMEAVGKKIRENVIDEMESLKNKIIDVQNEILKLNEMKDKVTGEHGSIGDIPNVNHTVEDAGKKDPLSDADLKVLLAKFMNEEIAGKLNPQTDAVRIKNIKDKADKLASEGRKEGSQIDANQSLGSLFDSMSKEQLSQVGGYFDKNASNSGFSTQEYLDYIKEFGQTAEKGKVMTHGDKQVMLAKYMKETLMPQADTKSKKDAINGTATKIADSGRKNTSLISPNVSYEQSLSKLSGKQQAELGQYMLDNSGVISFTELKDILIRYASNLRLNQSNDFIGSPASMDVGGMTKGFGSTGGTDGKGGRLALLHQNEIVSNPLDTERMLRISSIMDNVMRTINGAIALPTQPKVSTVSTPTSTDNSTVVHVNIDKFNGTKNDIDKLGDQIKNRLLREKGKR